MKKLTYPFLKETLVQDIYGATYLKKWLYFRPILKLETDFKENLLWKNKKTIIEDSLKKKLVKKIN